MGAAHYIPWRSAPERNLWVENLARHLDSFGLCSPHQLLEPQSLVAREGFAPAPPRVPCTTSYLTTSPHHRSPPSFQCFSTLILYTSCHILPRKYPTLPTAAHNMWRVHDVKLTTTTTTSSSPSVPLILPELHLSLLRIFCQNITKLCVSLFSPFCINQVLLINFLQSFPPPGDAQSKTQRPWHRTVFM
jgi:hypothetical protein